MTRRIPAAATSQQLLTRVVQVFTVVETCNVQTPSPPSFVPYGGIIFQFFTDASSFTSARQRFCKLLADTLKFSQIVARGDSRETCNQECVRESSIFFLFLFKVSFRLMWRFEIQILRGFLFVFNCWREDNRALFFQVLELQTLDVSLNIFYFLIIWLAFDAPSFEGVLRHDSTLDLEQSCSFAANL